MLPFTSGCTCTCDLSETMKPRMCWLRMFLQRWVQTEIKMEMGIKIAIEAEMVLGGVRWRRRQDGRDRDGTGMGEDVIKNEKNIGLEEETPTGIKVGKGRVKREGWRDE